MKNSEMFEKQLEELDRMPEGQAELARLRDGLRQVAGQDSPSPQEQAWAWTRLEARIREGQEEQAVGWLPFFKWAAFGAIGLFAVSVYLRSGAETGGAVQVASVRETAPALVQPAVLQEAGSVGEKDFQVPTVAMAHGGMHAVSFHSREAAADVIWATGYTYLPASFDPR